MDLLNDNMLLLIVMLVLDVWLRAVFEQVTHTTQLCYISANRAC